MPDWTCYDSGAFTHNSLAGPAIFAAPARDLVAALALQPGQFVLDVGSGAGAAAAAALQATRGEAVVVSLDPSPAMLRSARENGVSRVVAGALPNLPFGAGRFDSAMASFVLSHVAALQDALRDMLRVVRTSGQIGITSWGDKTDPYRNLWDRMAEEAAGTARLRAALEQGVPWQDWLADPSNLQSALEQAGAARVAIYERHYPVSMKQADFLAVRSHSITGRFLQKTLSAEKWREFEERVAAEFRARFPDPIENVRNAWIGVGVRT